MQTVEIIIKYAKQGVLILEWLINSLTSFPISKNEASDKNK
jgi:hypothetical protein